jgi:hypothetical protein
VSFAAVFGQAAHGKLPAADGRVEVITEDPGKAFAVVAFPAHFYVAAPVDPGWVRALLPPGDYGAPLGARFLTALADRLGAGIGTIDVVLVARAHGGRTPVGLRPMNGEAHPRVQRAQGYRDDVRAWAAGDGAGCLTLGRGLAGRWEVSLEHFPARDPGGRVRAHRRGSAAPPPRNGSRQLILPGRRKASCLRWSSWPVNALKGPSL